MKRAAALRSKYRLLDAALSLERRIASDAAAPHPSNWNAVRINGKQCEELFLQVFRKNDCRKVCHGAIRMEMGASQEAVACFHNLRWRGGPYRDSAHDYAAVRELGPQSY